MQCPFTGVFVPGAKPDGSSFDDSAWQRYTELCEEAGFKATQSLCDVKITKSDALIVVDRNREITPELRDRFETVTLLDSLVFPEIREKQRYYKVYVGRNLRSWPENPHRR